MSKGITNVCERYNGSVLFKIKPTPGDRIVLRTSGGITTRPIPEGYYMNRNAVKKPNPIINFFKIMYNTMKDIIAATKPSNIE